MSISHASKHPSKQSIQLFNTSIQPLYTSIQPINMLLLLMITFGILSCNPFSGGESGTGLKKEMEEVRQLIDEEIGEARADEESWCRALAMGAKPCGGPWMYLPYSAMESDEEKLKELADRYYALNRKYNEVTGLNSDCMFVAEPPVSLVNGHCEIVENNSD